MLKAELIAEGRSCRVYALERIRGSGEVENFFLDFLLDELEESERNGVLALIERVADHGRISGLPKHLRDDVWELKYRQVRILLFYRGSDIYITHAFKKKQKKTPKKEIERSTGFMRKFMEG